MVTGRDRILFTKNGIYSDLILVDLCSSGGLAVIDRSDLYSRRITAVGVAAASASASAATSAAATIRLRLLTVINPFLFFRHGSHNMVHSKIICFSAANRNSPF